MTPQTPLKPHTIFLVFSYEKARPLQPGYWRGPIWMPVNVLIIRALLQSYGYYSNDFTVECPTGSGRRMNLYQVAEEIARRLANMFLKGNDGRRPIHGGPRCS